MKKQTHFVSFRVAQASACVRMADREAVFTKRSQIIPNIAGFHFRDTSIWRVADHRPLPRRTHGLKPVLRCDSQKQTHLMPDFQGLSAVVPAPLSAVCHASRFEAI